MRWLMHAALLVILCLIARGVQSSPPADARVAAARAALDAGENARAEALAREILASEPEPLVEASALETLVNALVNLDRGETDEALASAQRCLQLRSELLQAPHPELARAHAVLARVLRAQRLYEEALASYQRALDSVTELADEEAELVANIRMNRANLLVSRGRAAEAVPELTQVLRSYESLFDGPHRLTAFAHYNLARALERTGEIDAALTHHESAVGIRTTLLPAEPALLATSAHEYGELLQSVGALSAAREQFQQAASLRERELGAEARPTLDSLDKLGDVELALGRPELAREYFERVQAARVSTLARNHVDLARSERNLGNVALELGDWTDARAHFERALEIREAQAKRSAQREAEELNNLAVAWSEAGDDERATAMYRRLLELHTQVLPPEHVDLAKDRLNLALSRLREADTHEAEQLAEAAHAQLRSGEDPISLRSANLVRGQVYLALGRLELATADFAAAVQLSREIYGADHVETAYALEWSGRALARRGQASAALDAALAAERVSRRDLRERTRALPEREALHYREAGHVGLGLALSLADAIPTRRVEIFEAVVQSRSLVLDELTRRDATAGEAERGAALQRARERYSFASASGAPPAELTRLRLAKELLEREQLGEAQRSEPTPTAAELFVALAPGEIMLAFAVGEGERGRFLVAFRVDRSGVQQVVQLGSESELANAVDRWRDAIARQSEDAAGLARELDRRLIEPFESALQSAERIFVVAAGPLHLLPFPALIDANGGYRVQMRAVWHRLDAERDRVGLVAAGRPDAAALRLLAVGGADFGRIDEPMPSCPSLAELRFEALPGSADEIEAIGRLWTGPKQILRGADAGELQVLAAMSQSDVVHLATHGFFLPRTCRGELGRDARVRGLGRLVRPPGQTAPPASQESPLLRSGLALAGANARFDRASGRDDGILTAEELCGLDLRHVQWLVLSACDTGLGDLQGGEGVLGLRRALRRAGAGTVVMSLWPVDDASTRTWMLDLYRSHFLDRLETARAVRAAQLAAIERGGAAADPFEWAGFVAVGDWR